MHFDCKKAACGQKLGLGGGLIDSPGGWRHKMHGGWKFSSGLNSTSPTLSTHSHTLKQSENFLWRGLPVFACHTLVHYWIVAYTSIGVHFV